MKARRSRLSMEMIDVEPIAVVGTQLRCATETGDVIVDSSQAVDKKEFYAHWNRLGGDKLGLTWWDGTPYDPMEDA